MMIQTNKLLLKKKIKQMASLLKNLFDCSQRYLFLLNNSSKHKKKKSLNKNAFATISYGEYKDFL